MRRARSLQKLLQRCRNTTGASQAQSNCSAAGLQQQEAAATPAWQQQQQQQQSCGGAGSHGPLKALPPLSQQRPAALQQLLQQLQAVHLHLQQLQQRCFSAGPGAASSSGSGTPPATTTASSGGSNSSSGSSSSSSSSHLQPYQQAAVDFVLDNVTSSLQQRLMVRLPPSADINPVLEELFVRLQGSRGLLLLASSTARVVALKSRLQQLLPPDGPRPKVVPGELLAASDQLLLVDLQQLQQVPTTSVQLAHHRGLQQGLAVFEQGFLNPGSPPASSSAAAAAANGSSSSSPRERQQQQQQQQPGQLLPWQLLDGATRKAAERELGQLRYLQPFPGRLLVTVTSRDWHLGLPAAAGQLDDAAAAAAAAGSGGCEPAAPQQPEFSLGYAAAAGQLLLRRAAALELPFQMPVQDSTAAAAAAAAAAGSAQPSSDDVVAAVQAAISSSSGSSSGSSGRLLVYAAGSDHARQLSVSLNLAGISSLSLHECQSAAEHAEVLCVFASGADRALVISSGLAASQPGLLAAGLGCDVGAVFMAAAAGSSGEYAAWLAPALLPQHPGSSGSSDACIVVDFVPVAQQQQEVLGVAAAGSAAAGSRRRRSRTTTSNGSGSSSGAGSSSSTSGSSTSGSSTSGSSTSGSMSSSIQLPLLPPPITCTAVLGSDNVLQLPASFWADSNQPTYKAAAAAAAAAGGDLAAAAAAAAGELEHFEQRTVRGDLIWSSLECGSWAIPIKKGRGTTMQGLKVLWLTKQGKGWVPELEEGLGQRKPLPGTSGKPMKLQRARHLAESWLKANHPLESLLREAGAEWRERPLSQPQVVFCERHHIPYDPRWTRGMANNIIDRWVVEEMRVPTTDRQRFLLKHLAPFAPAHLVSRNSTTLAYKRAAGTMLQSLLTGQFGSTATAAFTAVGEGQQPRLRGAAAAAAAAAAADAAAGVLLPRKALMEDLEAQFDAGLRPRYTWIVINGHDMLLDLLSGSYLWLRRAAAGSGSSRASSSSSSRGLSAAALYKLLLELPDGSLHPVASGAAAAALVAAHAGVASVAGPATAPAAAAAAAQEASDGSGDADGGGRLVPLPLLAALARGERVAASLAAVGAAFLTREDAVRVTGMIGGWKVPNKSTEQQMAMPASAKQLEQLKAAGLPYSRRYSCLDAHRELVRHHKSHGLPEPPATPTQLARIAELQLPLAPAAAGKLTAAQAKAALYLVQVAEDRRVEAVLQAANKARGGSGQRSVADSSSSGAPLVRTADGQVLSRKRARQARAVVDRDNRWQGG